MDQMQSDREKDAMRPTRFSLFLRTFFPYQVYRFAWINLRMFAMIRKSHPHSGRRAG
ncbi:MAG: hypothetical protein PHS14_06795 [Elusimicrobia bacterium]|nr:hypothetical protein [Elusimicrobiota bacterium]